MAAIHSCCGMGCPWENGRGDCRWKKGRPYPCDLGEMSEEDREYYEYFMEESLEVNREK